jgi:hypothetical protein
MRFRRLSAESGSGLVKWNWIEVTKRETIAVIRLRWLQIQVRYVRVN